MKKENNYKSRLLGSLCTVIFAFGYCNLSYAQSIDYGSLETLFGEPVTTSATGQPQRAPDVPVTMSIITADDIRRSGAKNVPDILRSLPGMSVWQWGRGQTDVSIRGYNQGYSPRLLVLLNGRQLYADDYGYTAWHSLPVQLDEIRQIEVVKGPNSALFGFNAVGGVINIITYNPLHDKVNKAGVSIGTNDYRQGHAVGTVKPTDKIGLRISAGATKMDEFKDPSNVMLYDPTQHETSLDSVVQLSDNSDLRIELSNAQSKLTEYPYVYQPFNTKYQNSSAKTTYTIDTDIGMLQANVYRNWLTVNARDSSFPVYIKNNVTVAQMSDLFQIGHDHSFRIQGEYRHNELSGSGTSSIGSETSYDVYAGSGMWNWKIRESLSWTNAVRVDYLDLERKGPLIANSVITSNDAFDKNLTEFSYNSGLVWAVSDEDTLRFMTARGIQAPALLSFGQDISFPPLSIIGNPNLKAAVVTNYEVGYDRKIKELGGGLRTNVFYQETKDVIGTDQAIFTGLTTQPGNIGNSHTVGLEAGLNGAFATNWTWDTNYTLQKVIDDLTVNQASKVNLVVPYNGEEATPLHTVNAHLGYTNGPWEIDGYAQYVSSYDVLLSNGAGYSPVEAGDFISFRGRVGYKINENLTAALSGQELNRSDIRETSGPKKERQVFLSMTASF